MEMNPKSCNVHILFNTASSVFYSTYGYVQHTFSISLYEDRHGRAQTSKEGRKFRPDQTSRRDIVELPKELVIHSVPPSVREGKQVFRQRFPTFEVSLL